MFLFMHHFVVLIEHTDSLELLFAPAAGEKGITAVRSSVVLAKDEYTIDGNK